MRHTWLIRHAESTGNAGEVTGLPATIPLSAAGKVQAIDLAGRFEKTPSRVIISPYGRTLATAQPLLDLHPDIPVETWPVHEFTFLPPAQYVGTTQNERSIPAGAYWELCDPDHRGGEGAETFREFIGRVEAALQGFSEADAPFVACFSHGYFIKGVLWRLLHPRRAADEAGMASFRDFHRCFPVDNTSIFPLLHVEGAVHLGPPRQVRLRHVSEE
jgi:broad specificity phosphatase PhoE